MQPKLIVTPKHLLAFLSLLFICHELHELVHTTVAYFQCGCWGSRDFNVWQVCAACPPAVNTVWATLVGPLLTYLLIWTGWVLMNRQNPLTYQSLGFALVWSNVPFARLFTVLMKGGDEGVITRTLINQPGIPTSVWLMEIGIVLLLITPAIVRAWQLIPLRRRALVFTGFLLGPMLIEFIAMHIAGNKLLQSGILSSQGVLGSPLLVTIWNGVWAVVLLLCFPILCRLFRQAEVHTTKKKMTAENFL